MSMVRVKNAIDNDKSIDEVAKAAVQDAAESASSEQEKEDLAVALYKEATGRFPQNSNDRRAVYDGAFMLLGGVFALVVIAATTIVLLGKSVPESLSILATALVSGVVGGLFGYAKQ